MKIRTGFVTNSSSSSFILSFRSKRAALSFLADFEFTNKKAIKKFRSAVEHAKHATRQEIREFLFYRFENDAKLERWLRNLESSRNDPLSRAEIEQINKSVNEIMEKIDDDNCFNIIIDQGDDTEIDSMLEHQILPYLPQTIASFSNH